MPGVWLARVCGSLEFEIRVGFRPNDLISGRRGLDGQLRWREGAAEVETKEGAAGGEAAERGGAECE